MIHALPGMGADRRMYPAPWQSLPGLVAHDWVRHTGEKSLADVARSMCAAQSIRDGDTLVGSSLGGMIACEITKIRQIPALYLIGSATCQEDIGGLLAALHPLARVAPLELVRLAAGKIPLELVQMFTAVEASFVRAMCAAIFEWEGLGGSSTRVYRIHGKYDLVIPPPHRADLLLEGGHLISMTHAQQCVDFVRTNQALRSAG